MNVQTLPIGVVINPTSGKGKGARAAGAVWQALAGVSTIDLSSDSYAGAQHNAREAVATGKISALIVVGGDGMVHLGVNACAHSAVPLGIVAAGTGNDSAMTLGLPLEDAEAAVRVVLDNLASPRSVDLIRGRSRGSERDFYSLGTVSAGFDAIVNAKANRMKWPKGPSRYQVAMVLELLRFRGISYTAVIDGAERKLEAMLCAVANAPGFGGGMLIAPHASIVDGRLDLFIVHRIPRRTLLRIFPKVYTGGHVTHPAVEFVSATEISLDAGDMPAYADGEFVGISPIQTAVAPAALRVCAPA
ncbi:MAG: diacylglycerol/lipid kinase family protein [Micrococcales bacterium]